MIADTASAGRSRRHRRLCRLIEHAHARVPYYRRLFDSAGIQPADVRTPADLSAVPVSGRGDLAPLPANQIIAAGVDVARLLTAATSGSTGEPFVIRRNRREQHRHDLIGFRDMRRCGLRARDRTASVFLSRRRPTLPAPARALLSSLGFFRHLHVHCGEEPVAILAALEAFRPTFLGGVPGTLCRVAEVMIDLRARTVLPRCLWLTGEVVTRSMRDTLERTFGARVHNAYGCQEVGLIASQCRESELLHVADGDLIVEVIKDDGDPAGPGESGTLVVTSLTAFSAPFIRYRLGDRVTRGPDRCVCGAAAWTLKCIDGRTVDHFSLPGGRLAHPWDISAPVLAASHWLRRYQLVQEQEDRVTLSVVRDDGPAASAACHQMVEQIQATLGSDVRLDVERVTDIPPGPGGKTRTLVSRVTRIGDAGPTAGRG